MAAYVLRSIFDTENIFCYKEVKSDQIDSETEHQNTFSSTKPSKMAIKVWQYWKYE